MSLVLSFAWLAPDALALTEVPGSEKRMIDQVQDEIEPALMSYTHFGVEYSVAVWMNFDPSIATAQSTLKYTAWTSNGLTNTGGTIPAVAGYSRMADPVLVKHPTSTRIFLAALGRTETRVDNQVTQIDTAIAVWYSDNGGWNWSSPRVIATDVWTVPDPLDPSPQLRATRWILDKPGIATAPNGTVWVTYTRRGGEATFNLYDGWVQAQSGTISGSTWTWSARTTVSTQNTAVAPAIVVDSDGDVYVLSTYGNGADIQLWRDDAQDANGVSFAQMPSVPDSGNLRNGTIAVGSVNIRAVSVPALKLDRTRRRIVVVWHEAPPGAPGETHLRLAVYRLDEPNAALRWTNVLFAAGTGVHHVNVGMDHDTNGNVVVTWYRFNPGSSVYWNLGKFVTFGANHTPSWVSDDAITTRLGDAANLTDDNPDPNIQGTRHIGEYHDVVFTNGKFKAVHLIAVAPWSDPWTFVVQQ